MIRGHREINQIQDLQKRKILHELRNELYRLCDEYGITRPPFLVNISVSKRHGQIRYFEHSRTVTYISISAKNLHPVFMNELINTVRHEFAHMYTLVKYGYANHGLNWKYFLRKIGGDGSRCATYIKTEEQKIAAQENYKFKYCKCGMMFRARMQNGYCKKCHTYVKDMDFKIL